MPLTIYYAHLLARQLTKVRREHPDLLKPDGKTQVSVEYENDEIKRIDTIVVSTQHSKDITQEEIKELMERNLTFRKNIQPSLKDPNAGSVFKNPENDSAGRLLDKAGVKSFETDTVRVWDKHANFIVNKGNATSEDVLELMVKMYQAVKNIYTIELKPEIIFIGDKTKKEEELCNILYKTKTQK